MSHVSLIGVLGKQFYGGFKNSISPHLQGDNQESSSHHDALSSSSGLLDLLLQEDSCSGTGSAVSGTMGSNGGSTSACGTSEIFDLLCVYL